MVRGLMAGYKANFQAGSYPSSEFLGGLNPAFANFATEKLSSKLDALGDRVGGLTAQAAEWTGLPAGIAIAVANVDAHVALSAANALQPGRLVLSMGNRTKRNDRRNDSCYSIARYLSRSN